MGIDISESLISLARNQRAADGCADPKMEVIRLSETSVYIGLHGAIFQKKATFINMLHICVSAPISKLWQKVVEKCTTSGGIILRKIVTR
jgi:hypothetical protein